MSDMAITSLVETSSSVRCAICARPARRGTTLCPQCKAAVKRARQVPSVHTEFLPHPPASTHHPSSRELGETRASSGRRGNRAAALALPSGWGTYATMIAFGVAVCLTGYLALGELGDATSVGLAGHSTEGTASGVAGEGAARPPLPSLASDEPVRGESPNTADVSDPQMASAVPDLSDKRSVRDPKQAKEAQPLPGFDPAIVIAAPIPAPAPQAVAAPAPPVVAAPEPAAPDRWQLLASATSRCERENPIAGLLCKERARLQYCEGYWGAAPQCSGSVAAANTR